MDRKPTHFQCLREAQGLYPPFFELWHCPQCHFTAHNRIFPDPLKDVAVEKGFVRSRLQEEVRARPAFKRIADALGQGLAELDVGFESALRKALLAIHFGTWLVALLQHNHYGMAQAYLRVAWLYRDRPEQDADPDTTDAHMAPIWEQLSADWPEAPRDEDTALLQACDWFRKTLDAPSRSGDSMLVVSTYLHMARVHLQRQDPPEVAAALNECRQELDRNIRETTEALRTDDHTKRMSSDERARMMTVSRKLQNAFREWENLRDDYQLLG